ncbi:MAG TPA: MFS transporter [Candidatus Nanoarchaeia archaeon]|nr:MFS transporter [Candidatus Nanoarchaeia archaeon]
MQKKNFSILPIFLVVFIDLLGIGVVIPILGPLFLGNELLSESYTFSARTILLGFLIASYSIAQFFGSPILGALSDKYGRKKVLFLSLPGTFLGYLLFGVALLQQNLLLLFVSRIIGGFSGGNLSIVMSSIADLSDEKSKAKNFGLVGMAFGLGFIFGPFIGGKLADPTLVSWFNYATPLWFAAILSLFNMLMVANYFKETSTTRLDTKISMLTGFRNIQKAFTIKNLRVIFIIVFLITLGFNFFTQFFQVLLIEKFSFNQSDIGNLFAFVGIWIAFSQGVLTRVLSKKFSPKQILPFSILFLAISLPLLLLPSKLFYLYAANAVIAIFAGLTFPNYTAIVSGLSAKDSQGEILGINQSIQAIGIAIPPIVAGFIVSIHLYLPIIVSAALMFIAWLVFVMFFKEKEKEVFHEV